MQVKIQLYQVVVERKVWIKMNCRSTPGLIVCIILLVQLLKQRLTAQKEYNLINLKWLKSDRIPVCFFFVKIYIKIYITFSKQGRFKVLNKTCQLFLRKRSIKQKNANIP